MQHKTEAELIYCALGTAENGSPINKEISKVVRASLLDSFSANYYFERGREMRDNIRLCVNIYHTYDIEEDGLSYSLMYVKYKGKKYTVENIMAHYLRNYKKDTMSRDLDLRLSL